MASLQATVWIERDLVLFGALMAVLGLVFWTSQKQQGFWPRFYGFIPPILLCYLLPALLNTFGVIDGSKSGLYPFARDALLPCSLLLLCLGIDLPGLLRLGPKVGVMFVASVLGVMLGGLVAFELMRGLHPETVSGDAWRGMTTLAGTWIGGAPNQAAMKEIFAVSPDLFAQFIAVDVVIAYGWMVLLILIANRRHQVDRWLNADTRALDQLTERLRTIQAEQERPQQLSDVMVMLGLGFGVMALAHAFSAELVAWVERLPAAWQLQRFSLTSTFFWVVVLTTAIGIGLSMTRLRRLEGVGASRLGQALLYVLIACIGMQMNLKTLADRPGLLLLGAIWISVHGLILLLTARWLRAPAFLFAVSSQACIGGPASAPVVAAIFHPALAPVGVLLAVFGYAVGTYAAYVLGLVLQALAS